MIWDVRHGDYRDIGWQYAVDNELGWSLISDPPFSERTHKGRRTGSEVRKSEIPYASMSPKQAREFVKFWASMKPEWWVLFSDDALAQVWKKELARAGQYVFAPIPWVKPDAAPRMTGDGPASGTEWIVVARWPHNPRRMGSRPPWYFEPTASTRSTRPGTKPLGLMRRLISDYSEPGQTVIDPFMGTGTTLLAAVEIGRRALGCDIDQDACNTASARLAEFDKQPPLPGVQRMLAKQAPLF